MILISSLGQFSFCINWNSEFNFLIHCFRALYTFLKLVAIVTFPLFVHQMRLTVSSFSV